MVDMLKRVWCIILSVTIILLSVGDVTSVYANEINNPEEYEYYTEIGATLGYFGYESNESIYCSQILDVLTEEYTDETAMMVFEGDETIGMLTKQVIEGNIMYSFIYSNFEELDEIVDDGKEITLVNDDDKLFCVTDDNVEVIIEKNTDSDLEMSIDVLNAITKQKINGNMVKKEKLPNNISFDVDEKYEVDDITEGYNNNTSQWGNISTNGCYTNDRYHAYYYKLNVPYVKNDEWYPKMLSLLGIKYHFYDRKLSYNEVVASLKQGRPIKIGIYRYENNIYKMGHAVVLCGTFACLIDGNYYYVYMDPNINGYVVNSVIESTRETSTGTTFYYKVGGCEFNNWCNSYSVYK